MSGKDASPEIAVYYPNVIGRSYPGSQSSYAILIEGRDDGKGEVIVKAMEKLVKMDVRILSQKGYVSERVGTFSLLLLCQLPNVSLDDLVIQIRKIKHVTNAQYVSQRSQMFDGMMFPLLLMDSERVVAISPEVIFNAQQKLSSAVERAALVEAGRQYGVEIVDSIKNKFAFRPDGKRIEDLNIPVDVVEENIARYLKAAGWGKISWDHGTTLERVFLNDPPAPRSKDATVAGNRLIEGLISGLTEGLQGKRFSIVEDHYDSQRRVLTIGMVEASVALKMEQQKIQKPMIDDTEILEKDSPKITAQVKEVPQLEQQEVLATPVIGGSKLHLTYTKKSMKQDAVEKQPAVVMQASGDSDSIDEQKRKLEEKTKELELLIREVEKRITKTKEGLEETDSATKALDKTASLATKYLTQVKQSEKSMDENFKPIRLPQKKKQIEFSEEEIFAQEDGI